MLERRVMFRPGDPSMHGLSLHGEAVVPDDPPLLAVLCHGIPGSAPRDPTDDGYGGFARTLAARGFGAFWFDFRGVRGMPGEFSIGNWCADLESALDTIDADAEIGGIPRVLIGSSAGGAVALAVAARREDVAAVATLAAPASFTFGALVEDPGRLVQTFRNTGIIHDPTYPGDLDAWWREFEEAAPEETIGGVARRPVLLMHGDADDVIPYPHVERLFIAAGEPKERVHIPGGGHQLRRDPRAIDALTDWLGHLGLKGA
jgi:alpha-beta hydrolase superfamily lysophospholipase